VIGHPVRLLKKKTSIARDQHRPAEVTVVDVSLNLTVVACTTLRGESGTEKKGDGGPPRGSQHKL